MAEVRKTVHKVKTVANVIKKAATIERVKSIGSGFMQAMQKLGEAGQNFNRNYHPLIATSKASVRKKYSGEKYRKKRKQ